jgi:hypothetical protein
MDLKNRKIRKETKNPVLCRGRARIFYIWFSTQDDDA